MQIHGKYYVLFIFFIFHLVGWTQFFDGGNCSVPR